MSMCQENSVTEELCTLPSQGSFSGSGTFAAYKPFEGEIEECEVPNLE